MIAMPPSLSLGMVCVVAAQIAQPPADGQTDVAVELELRAGNERAAHAVLLLDDQGTGPLVPEGQLLRLSGLYENVLGRAIRDT